MVMIGAFLQPSTTSPLGKAGGFVRPSNHGETAVFGKASAVYGVLTSKSNDV
jgi:hypothetical protein